MQLLATLAILVGELSIIGGALIWVERKTRALRQMAVDWHGQPERKDPAGIVIDPARPGLQGRLVRLEDKVAAIDKEMHPNAGKTARDAINRLEDMVRDIQRELRERRDTQERPSIEASGMGFQAERAEV